MGELEFEPEGPTFTHASNIDISGESGGAGGTNGSPATTGIVISLSSIMVRSKLVDDDVDSDVNSSLLRDG